MDRIANWSPHRYRRSYKAKLVTIALVIVVVAAGFSALFVSKTGASLTTAKERQLTDAAKSQGKVVDRWLLGLRTQATLLSRSESLRRGEFQVSEHVVGIHRVDLDNDTVLASSVEDAVGQTVASERWERFNESFSDRKTARITHPFRTSLVSTAGDEKRWVMAVGSPTPDDGNQVVVMLVDLKRASQVLTTPKDGSGYVVMRDGTVLLSHDGKHIGEDASGGNFVPQRTLQAVQSGKFEEGGTATIDFDSDVPVDGKRSMQAAAPVIGQGMVVSVNQPRSTALTVKHQVLLFMGGLTAVLLVVGLNLFAITVGRTTLRDLRRLSEDALAVADGDLDREITSDRDDEFGAVFRAVDKMRTDIKTQIDELEELTTELERRNRRLTDAVERHSAVMAQCADGDLTARMDTDSGVDQIDALAREFNQMVAEIETMAVDLKRFAGEVATNAEKATASTDEVRSASDQVSDAIQHISDGNERQYEGLERITAEMETLSRITDEIASQANKAARLAGKTAEVGRESREEARQAVDGMEEVQETTDETVAQMETLADRMDEIDRLAESIETIADDTNRIALNANIEASRAAGSDTDEGFDAVAEEIRELAEDARDSAQEIDRIVGEVDEQTRTTVESVRENGKLVAEQTELVERTVEALEEIAQYTERTEKGIRQISAATEKQSSSTDEIAAMVARVTEISETNAGKANTVASAAESQTTALSRVAEGIDSLSEEADDLMTEMDRFATGEDETADDEFWVPSAPGEGSDPSQ